MERLACLHDFAIGDLELGAVFLGEELPVSLGVEIVGSEVEDPSCFVVGGGDTEVAIATKDGVGELHQKLRKIPVAVVVDATAVAPPLDGIVDVGVAIGHRQLQLKWELIISQTKDLGVELRHYEADSRVSMRVLRLATVAARVESSASMRARRWEVFSVLAVAAAGSDSETSGGPLRR